MKCEYCDKKAEHEIVVTRTKLSGSTSSIDGFKEKVRVCNYHSTVFDSYERYEKTNNILWVIKGRPEGKLVKIYGRISGANFKVSDSLPWLGLFLEIKLENGNSNTWSFFSLSDIKEVMEVFDVKKIPSLIGKIVECYHYINGNYIIGLSINKNLI